MTIQSDIRKAIGAQLPELQFKIRTVDFTDLARGSKVFVESNAWGMTRGNNELYQRVCEIVRPYNVIVSW